MLRRVLGTLAGLLAWIVIVTLLNFGLRAVLPGYAAVEKAMTFTLVMMLGAGWRSALPVRWPAASSPPAWAIGRRR